MKISINNSVDHSISYRFVSEKGTIITQELPIYFGKISGFSQSFEAMITTADLQGRELDQETNRLLGEEVPNKLSTILSDYQIDIGNCISILAGDFYSRELLDRRGGHGDVLSVWSEFAKLSKQVIGVAGNHDLFKQDSKSYREFSKNDKIHFLDHEILDVERIRFGGLGGIIGNPRKPYRKSQEEYVDFLKTIICSNPDILIMHDGPVNPHDNEKGIPGIREILESTYIPLIVRGHKHWDHFFVQLANGSNIINVHEKIVVLINESVE